MIDNPYLDTLISLVLVYALLSTLVSILTEWLNQNLNARGKFLQETIFKMMNDPANENYGYMLYRHPILDRYRKDNKSLPQYVSAEAFSQSLIEVLSGKSLQDKIIINADGTHSLSELPLKLPNADDKEKNLADAEGKKKDIPSLFERFEAGVNDMSYSDTKRLFRHFIDRANSADQGKQLEYLQKEIALWFNEHMDRATGWYLRKQRPKFIVMGFLVALLLNVDSIHLSRVLLMDPLLRSKMVTLAENTADAYSSQPDSAVEKRIQTALDSTISFLQRDTVELDSSLMAASWKKIKWFSDAKDTLKQNELNRQMYIVDKMASYGLPIGYQDNVPPVSWWKENKAEESVTAGSSSKIQNYFQRRSQLTFVNAITYLFGITITGISLSFGAPFWFELLVKFVNIRRSGVKPTEKKDDNKK